MIIISHEFLYTPATPFRGRVELHLIKVRQTTRHPQHPLNRCTLLPPLGPVTLLRREPTFGYALTGKPGGSRDSAPGSPRGCSRLLFKHMKFNIGFNKGLDNVTISFNWMHLTYNYDLPFEFVDIKCPSCLKQRLK